MVSSHMSAACGAIWRTSLSAGGGFSLPHISLCLAAGWGQLNARRLAMQIQPSVARSPHTSSTSHPRIATLALELCCSTVQCQLDRLLRQLRSRLLAFQ
ncbi:hypothetical protein RTBOTA2_006959 [Rhodotorula toruloides]|nr:hypothetical protein RTBOTA2_006942 [Rhodotorula toruloides]KAK4331255.1 hypothetical protein RTBOTA2_006951 [Rhodotorula toruloides]KAK4331269.1 hypothetical protein RTBOTA2_006959 [Rhodotorula toruloides]